MILSCQGISKSFGEKVILNDASFHIESVKKPLSSATTEQVRQPFSVL